MRRPSSKLFGSLDRSDCCASSRPVAAGRRVERAAGEALVSARHVPLVLAAVLGVAACGRNLTPTEPATTDPVVVVPSGPTDGAVVPDTTSSTDTLTVPADTSGAWIRVGVPPVGMVGQELRANAAIFGPQAYETYWTEFTWAVSDTSVARFRSGARYRGLGANPPTIEVVGAGTVTFSVSAEGVVGTRRMLALATEPLLNYELEVESFDLKEIFTADGESTGAYRPEMTLKNRGLGPIEVFGVQVSVVGLDALPYCWTHAPVGRGQTTDLFQVVYGDFDLAFGGTAGIPGPASVVIYFVDGDGGPSKMTATASITPGSPPDPYRHDPDVHGWSCGPHWTPLW
jgi:hypothetical protein